MEVGDYVRTKEGFIAKLKHFGIKGRTNNKDYLFDSQIRDISTLVYDEDNFLWEDEFEEYVISYSKNIKDILKARRPY